MKRILLTLTIALSALFHSHAQVVVLSENFNNYDSLSGANYNGWSLTYIGPFSYYTSTQSSGPSGPHSYKFGFDSATAITPVFAAADSMVYWTKGNGTDSLSRMYVSTTTDGINYTLLDSYTFMNPQSNLPGVIKRYALPAGTIQVKFFYDKSVGNFAFDDFLITKNNSGIGSINGAKGFALFPNPSKGEVVKLTINEPGMREPSIKVFNMLGGEIKTVEIEKLGLGKYTMRFNSEPDGFYFVKVQTEKGLFTQRLTLN